MHTTLVYGYKNVSTYIKRMDYVCETDSSSNGESGPMVPKVLCTTCLYVYISKYICVCVI